MDSVKLGRNETIIKDIYYILDVEEQPVLKQSNELKYDTSLKIDPSNSKKAKKAAKKKKQKLAKKSRNISHNIFSELQINTEVPDKKDTDYLDKEGTEIIEEELLIVNPQSLIVSHNISLSDKSGSVKLLCEF